MALTKPRAYQIFDLDYKQSVRALATTNVTLSGGAPNVVDSVELEANDRILVKDQSTASQNGLYIVDTVGTGSNGTWIRSVDGNETGEIQAGMIVMVTEGTVYKDTQWKLVTNDPIVIGVTALTFELNTSTSAINNGNSNVTIGELGGNVTVSVGGTANVATFTTTGLTANNIATDGNLVVGNNLVVNGNLTYINVTDLNIEDPIIGLGRGPNNAPLTVDDNKDRGTQLWYYTTSEQSAFVGWDDSAGKLIAAANVTIANEIVTVNNYGTLVAGTLESVTVSATGNILAGNVLTVGLVSATGNVVGNYFIGNGSQLTGLQSFVGATGPTGPTGATGVAGTNGATGVAGTNGATGATGVAGTNGATGVAGTNGATGATGVAGTNGATGATGVAGTNGATGLTGNIGATGTFSGTLTSNVDGGGFNISNVSSVSTTGFVSATGNINAGNVVASGLSGTLSTAAQTNITLLGTLTSLSVTGNVQGGNVRTVGLVSAAGNVTGGNVIASANLIGGNITTVGIISATGNVTGNYFLGNGSQLTGISASSYGDANVTSLLSNFGSNSISTTGNITAANINSANADLAEMYVADASYPPGTVVEFGGDREVTESQHSHSTRVAGIVSTSPSYLMNADQVGEHVVAVALIGRVPCRVTGTIGKGDRLVASDIPGTAQRLDPDRYKPACIVGKALEAYNSDQVGTIEVAVGRT
jgi:hypothetical protein